MWARREHAKAPAAIQVVELVGVSKESWGNATQQVVARAAERHRHITRLDVPHSN
jgi:flavin-binding protein dodecin